MATLLRIDSSPRGNMSVSKTLGDEFTNAWQQKHAGGNVVVRDVTKDKLPFVDVPWIGGAYTPADKRSADQAEAIQISDELVDELLAADEVLITFPMYNFSIPASLKAWVDHVVRLGRTFTSDYKGLVPNKKAWLIVASAGEYAPGSHSEGYNMASTYMKQILGFMGITDVQVLFAGGTAGIGQGKVSMQDYLSQHRDEIVGAAQ